MLIPTRLGVRLTIAAIFVVLFSASITAGEPNVVVIEARSATPESTEPLRRGLGFVVESDGFVLTAYENLTDPHSGRLLARITVRLSRGEGFRSLPARIISVEPTLGFGILKLDADSPLRVSQVRRDAGPTVGEEIFAVVDPIPEGATPVKGRISGLNTKECYQQSLTATMVRAEIELPRDAIGAPLYGADGRVIALYTGYAPIRREPLIDGGDDIHVLPIRLVFNIYDSIKRRSSLVSPWTGFSVRSLEPEEYGIFPTVRGHRAGIGIEYVWPGGPAERMGVRPGDVLVQLSYSPIASVADFQKWLYAYGVGHEIKLVFVRDRKDYWFVDYVIQERPGWAIPQ